MRGATSAPTERALDVIEYLASADSESRRFSDVARELDLTQATAHAILKTLCDRGWAVRDPATRAFALGAGFSAVAAKVRPAALHTARAMAADIASRLTVSASVVEKYDDTLVIAAYEHGPGPRSPARPGDQIPYAPPFGVAFAAWDSDSARHAWVQRAAGATPALAKSLNGLLDRTRERGYDVDRTTLAVAQAAQLMSTLKREGIPGHVHDIMDRLLHEFTSAAMQPDDASDVATIAAPVFDDQGRVELILCAHPGQPLTGDQADAIGQTLLTYTTTLSTP